MSALRLRTERLELVAMTHALATAQIEDRMRFFRMLSVRPRADWPPPLVDAKALTYTQERLANAEQLGWQAWVWIDPIDALVRELVGYGGFNGPPDGAGEIEIGYSLLPHREGQGYASEAVAGLLGWALKDPRVKRVIAYTMADGWASQRLLERQGFVRAKQQNNAAVVLWERGGAA
ncbi:MAG: GNAT family N-acetyltransferase [Hyphomonadaceae bacterium]|nr:GNAT family N-acetyltransferase [Hyphomonadaceae bacterium]